MPEPTGELARFQDDFASALAGDERALARLGVDAARAAAGLSVYRNTIARGLIDALAASFPTVRRLVGEAWFAAAAGAFARACPPRERVLIGYGDEFPDFLARFAPAAELPYLPGVAGLDWLWLEAHVAADAPAWSAAAAAAVPPRALVDLKLALHPAARLAWFEAMNTASLWSLNRPPAPPPEATELTTTAEGLLLTRPRGAVEHRILRRGAFALLSACRAGATLGEAAVAALDAEPAFDLASELLRLVEAGAFAEPEAAGP